MGRGLIYQRQIRVSNTGRKGMPVNVKTYSIFSSSSLYLPAYFIPKRTLYCSYPRFLMTPLFLGYEDTGVGPGGEKDGVYEALVDLF